MRLVRTTLLLSFALLFITCRSKREVVNSGTPPDPRWTAVDSLQRIGQYATALVHTDTLLAKARATGDWRTEYRAWSYRAMFVPATGGSGDSVLLAMEERAATAPVPLKQLLLPTMPTSGLR